jgi:hypothetical protein
VGQRSLSPTSLARSRSTVREAGVRPDVPLGLGKAVTAALGVLAAVFSILGLEDFNQKPLHSADS